MDRLRATTVIAVRRDGEVAMAGDGQVTLGDTIMKMSAVKIRSMYNGQVLVGFAGAAADALFLIDRFESQLDRSQGNLRRAAVDLAKDWRTDRYLRRLEAQLVLADLETLLLVSGDGDVIEPDDRVIAIGSGGAYAFAAAQSLIRHTDLGAREIASAAMNIAADICIYTNHEITLKHVSGPIPVASGERNGRA